MSQISKKQAKEALGGLTILTSMLEAANGSSSRFDNLLKHVDVVRKITELYIKKDPQESQITDTSVTTIEQPISGSVAPIKPKELTLEVQQPIGGGKVTKVKA